MYEWKCVIKSTCLVASLHLVQARMVKTYRKKGQQEKNIFLYIKQGSITHSLM